MRKIYSAAGAAGVLGISHAMVRTLLQSGRLKGTKVDNGAWVVEAEALEAFEQAPRRRAKPIGQLGATRR